MTKELKQSIQEEAWDYVSCNRKKYFVGGRLNKKGKTALAKRKQVLMSFYAPKKKAA